MPSFHGSHATTWLDQFSPSMRGAIGDPFYRAIRDGAASPDAVLVQVERILTLRCLRAAPALRADYAAALRSLLDARDSALAFARYAIWRDALPAAQRERLRQQARREGIEAVIAEREGQR